MVELSQEVRLYLLERCLVITNTLTKKISFFKY